MVGLLLSAIFVRLMKYCFTTLLMLCIFNLFAQQNKNIPSTTSIYNEEGKLQMRIDFSPSCSCRTYTEYFTNGKVYAKRLFKVTNNVEYIDGEDITYFSDGTIKIYKKWKDAIPEGRAYTKFDNGNLEHEEFYENKLKTGTWKYYNQKGELIKEQIYVPGKNAWNTKRDFMTVNYYSKGKLAFSETYTDGKKTKSNEPITVRNNVPEITDGKTLFTLKCSACHAANKDGYGPALQNITKKRNEEWLYKMIRNSEELLNNGDKDALFIFNKWRKIKHPNMEKLSKNQTFAIIDYLKKMK